MCGRDWSSDVCSSDLPLVQAFRWPEIRTGATVDGVVTVVDCEALAAGQEIGRASCRERV